MKKGPPENQIELPFDLPAPLNVTYPPLTTDDISGLFMKVYRIYQNRSKKTLNLDRADISYYPYRSLKHTLRIRKNIAIIKISLFAENQPALYFELLAHCLWSDLFRMKCSVEYRKRFIEMENRLDLGLRGYGRYARPEKKIKSQGNVCDLDRILKKIIREYRFGGVNGVRIGWSRNRARRRLGYYDVDSGTIVISGILDHSDVPPFVVEYIVYHELLHHIIPFEKSGSNKRYHGAFFKRHEQKFRDYSRAEQWLKKEYPEWLNRFVRIQRNTPEKKKRKKQ